MKVSVIVPMHNAEDTIDRLYQSLARSEYKNLEIIFVDNVSTDRSFEKVKYYQIVDLRIKVVREERFGVSYARRRGFQEATGEYVYFIDADDYVTPNGIKDMTPYNGLLVISTNQIKSIVIEAQLVRIFQEFPGNTRNIILKVPVTKGKLPCFQVLTDSSRNLLQGRKNQFQCFHTITTRLASPKNKPRLKPAYFFNKAAKGLYIVPSSSLEPPE